MIITNTLDIKTTNKNITYYKKINPDLKSGGIININPTQLPIGSHQDIKVICDNCKCEKNIQLKIITVKITT